MNTTKALVSIKRTIFLIFADILQEFFLIHIMVNVTTQVISFTVYMKTLCYCENIFQSYEQFFCRTFRWAVRLFEWDFVKLRPPIKTRYKCQSSDLLLKVMCIVALNVLWITKMSSLSNDGFCMWDNMSFSLFQILLQDTIRSCTICIQRKIVKSRIVKLLNIRFSLLHHINLV